MSRFFFLFNARSLGGLLPEVHLERATSPFDRVSYAPGVK